MNKWLHSSLLEHHHYIPHGHCYLWQTPLVSLHVTSDLLIAIAYFSIPAALVYFVRKRQDMPFSGIFILFSLFITACGIGHLLDIWTLWFPNYWISGLERAFTAFISCLTAIRLLEWTPQFLALRSPRELEMVNIQLQQEIIARQQAQKTLQNLLEATASTTGDAFFTALTQQLTQALQVKHALISELSGPEQELLSTLAIWSDGQPVSNVTIALWGNPCDVVVREKRSQYFPYERLKTIFSESEALNIFNTFGYYLGVPLLDGQGNVLGTICVIGEQPLENPQEAEAIMNLFATKAAAELQRQRAEEALRKAYMEMEERVAERTAELSQANIRLTNVAQQERTIAQIIQQMRQSLDLSTIFEVTTQELRLAIACDRVIVYRFNTDWSGNVITESYGKEWRSLLSLAETDAPWNLQTLEHEQCVIEKLSDNTLRINDTYLQKNCGQMCRQEFSYLAVNDIYDKNFSPCYLNLLESLQARAYVVAPIYAGQMLWGLLACYQNSAPRQWQVDESQIITRVSDQLGVAIQQAELFQRTQQQAQELQYAKEVADRANRSKSEFLANMSHELRTPLNAVLGFTQVMSLDAELSEQHKNYLRIINTSGEHLLSLINNVLEMSKIEAGQLSLHTERFNLSHLLIELQDLLGLKANNKGLFFDICQDDAVPNLICGDKGKIRQILLNLIGNSIKFTHSGGIRLIVSVFSPSQVLPSLQEDAATSSLPPAEDSNQECLILQFTVEDTGVGMDDSEIDALFQPFQQTQSGIQSGQGTGLGFSLSQQYVTLMGGAIAVESALGEGTKITFTIPTASENPEYSVDATVLLGKEPTQGQPRSQYRILIVEDNAINQLLIEKVLEPLDLEVRTANNGEEAVSSWQTWHPHLIWLDMRMPRMDGYQAARTIRALELEADLPPCVIIALTATAFKESRSAMIDAGCDDVIYKPFRVKDLLEKMQCHLDLELPDLTERSPLGSRFVPSEPLQPENLSVMPIAWIQELQQACLRCNDQEVVALVTAIPPEHQFLATRLYELINVFQFDQVLNLTNSFLDAYESTPVAHSDSAMLTEN